MDLHFRTHHSKVDHVLSFIIVDSLLIVVRGILENSMRKSIERTLSFLCLPPAS